MFRRKIYSKLASWKAEKAGEYALMIQGARRVGKSTIIEEFVRNEYDTYIVIRFEKANKDILKLFDSMDDLDRFFLELQLYTHVQLKERHSAIVFDEVQLFPLARQAIKTLVADGRYDYYETGSLISIKKNVKDILIPSEEDTINMYPMDFEEFLWATGDTMTMDYIRDSYEKMEPLGQVLHNRVMEQFRTYIVVGGMPQAVSAYVEKKSFNTIEGVKRSIIDLYLKDTAKLDGNKSFAKASMLLRNLSAQLEKHDKSFSPGMIKKDAGIRDFRRVVDDLGESMMVNLCYRITEPAIDQAGHFDGDDFKMYLCDTGLLVTLSFGTSEMDKDSIYKALVKGNLNINNGMYFENMVAQELRMAGHDLYFSKFEHKDSEKLQEVDFVIVVDRKPVPVEVKSGRKYKEHKSLDRFMDKYGRTIGDAFVIYPGNVRVEGKVTYLPIYMVSLL